MKPASAGPHLQHLILSLPPLSWSSGQSDPVPLSSRLQTLSCLQHFAVGIFLAQNTLLLETPPHPWSLRPMRGFPKLPYPRDFLQALQLSSLFISCVPLITNCNHSCLFGFYCLSPMRPGAVSALFSVTTPLPRTCWMLLNIYCSHAL